MSAISIRSAAVSTNAASEPLYSPHGYIVTEDGTCYSLLKRWYHGVALAILFPEVAKETGYEPPDEEPNVFHYQHFELDQHDKLPVIRVCPSRMLGPCSVNKSRKAATAAQVATLAKLLKMHGLKARDNVSTDEGDRTVQKCLEMMRHERSW